LKAPIHSSATIFAEEGQKYLLVEIGVTSFNSTQIVGMKMNDVRYMVLLLRHFLSNAVSSLYGYSLANHQQVMVRWKLEEGGRDKKKSDAPRDIFKRGGAQTGKTKIAKKGVARIKETPRH
jgi:hypothetical protein